ncbi:BQ5605_C001g00605 [Microbotryum silenes-dioicae]|uniref:BQ5605_C001g00605 protein n=1 Tax=Microbotryum silenes-dioicae TaxID=796604 RepID=A0A2X0P696_9BASI|nr:BQ5605_C001g00605 [Microbotryum silenes-dioicae]
MSVCYASELGRMASRSKSRRHKTIKLLGWLRQDSKRAVMPSPQTADCEMSISSPGRPRPQFIYPQGSYNHRCECDALLREFSCWPSARQVGNGEAVQR